MKTWVCSELTIVLAMGGKLKAPGSIVLEDSGDVEISAELDGLYDLRDFLDNQPVVGNTPDGFEVNVEEAFCVRAEFDPVSNKTTTRFGLLRCVLAKPRAAASTKRVVFLKSARISSVCKVQTAGVAYTLTPLPNGNDRRQGIIRATLEVTGPDTVDYGGFLCLLSMAQRCQIHSPLEELYAGPDLVRVVLSPNTLPLVAGWPLIPETPKEVESFLVQTLPKYAALEKNYEIRRLVDFFCRSVQEPFAEVKFILASVFMEAFKFYWALNIGKRPPDKKANGLIRGFQKVDLLGKPVTNKNGDPVLSSFEELLEDACKAVGYTTTFTFIEDRNALFHSGAPGAYQRGNGSTWQAIKPELETLYRQIDDILLKLLGYKGPIHRWDDPDVTEQFV